MTSPKHEVDHIYIAARTKFGGLQIQTKKRAELEVYPYNKNPKKRTILKASKDPRATTISYYIDSPDYVCISSRGMFVSISEDDIELITRGLLEFKNKKDERSKEHLEHLKQQDKRIREQNSVNIGDDY